MKISFDSKIEIKRETLLAWGAVALLCVMTLALRANFFTLPLDCDEGVYSYTAWRMNYGEMPYRDVIDHKPPVIYLVYFIAFKLFGYSFTAVRGFTALWIALTVIAVYAVGSRLFSRKAGLASAFIFTLYQAGVQFQGAFSNVENFQQLPLLLALFFAWPKEGKTNTAGYFLSGLFFSVAIFMKETAALAAVFYLFVFPPPERKPANFAALAAGALVPFAALLSWLWANGALKAFIRYGIEFNLFYFSGHTAAGAWLTKLRILGAFCVEYLLPMAGFVYVCYAGLAKKAGPAFAAAASFCIALISMALIMKGPYPHYYLVSIPFLCLCAGLATVEVLEKSGKTRKAVAVAVLAVIFSATFGIRNAVYFGQGKGEKASDPRFTETFSVSAIVSSVKKEGDTVFCWPVYPEIYFETLSKSPVKLIYAHADYANFDNALYIDTILQGVNSRPDIMVLPTEVLSVTPFNKVAANYRSYAVTGYLSVLQKKGSATDGDK